MSTGIHVCVVRSLSNDFTIVFQYNIFSFNIVFKFTITIVFHYGLFTHLSIFLRLDVLDLGC